MIAIKRLFVSRIHTELLLAVILACSFSSARAASELRLTNAVFQEIEVKGDDGKIERKTIPAARVVPGTEVFYVISYQNAGDKAAEKIAITNPVPKELEYIAAIGPSIAEEVSVDAGKNYGALTNLSVALPDGNTRPAKASDVTHVRWKLASALKPGDEGKVSFRARLK